MLAVFLTGNYGFFNLLTAALCIPLLDDRAWRTVLPWSREFVPDESEAGPWRSWVLGALALPLVVVSALQLVRGMRWIERGPAPLLGLERALQPFRSVNSYGLFRVMTRERPEILVEGSRDGVTWETYRFRYKPAELDRPPAFAGPHMPRLDWQLWFVGLEWQGRGRSRWTMAFLDRLLEGSPPVLDLLRENPFPDEPPRFVRALVAPYRFAGAAARAEGTWWRREEPVLFLPVRQR
jgi:hypothetical protein